MTRRFLYSLVISVLIPVMLVTLLIVVTSSSSPGGNNGAQKESKVVSDPGYVPSGAWSDLPLLPTVSLGFGNQQAPNAPLKLKRAGAAAYPANGKIYILGGRHRADGDDMGSSWIWEYDPANPTSFTRKNAQVDSGPYGSRYVANMAVATLNNGMSDNIYAIGGSSTDSTVITTVRVYNPASDTIVSLPPADGWPANPPRVPGGYAVLNNKLYIFGGYSSKPSSAMYADTWRFDPAAPTGSKWTQLAGANLSVARGYIAGAALDGYIYAIGGDIIAGGVSPTVSSVSVVERLDPSAGSPVWSTVASLPTARGDMGAWAYDSSTSYEISGKIVVAGGGYTTPDTSAYIYDPQANAWSSFAPMLRARRNYASSQLNGILYAWGGYNVGGSPVTYDGSNTSMQYDASQGGTPLPTNTATRTVTGTPPTSTPTRTVTNTPLATNTPTNTNTPTLVPTICSNYNIVESTGTIVPGTTDIGNHTDDNTTNIALPFAFNLYGQSFTSVDLGPNGNAQFSSANIDWTNDCLPSTTIPTNVIMPYWDDQITAPAGKGIFTSISGTAPNRIFNIEWRTCAYSGPTTCAANSDANYELRLYETTGQFDIIYGTMATAKNGSSATIGAQKDATTYKQYSCNTVVPNISGKQLSFTLPACGSPVPTSTSVSPTNTVVATSTNTSVPPTNTVPPVPTNTQNPLATDTPVVPTSTSVPGATDTPVPATATAGSPTSTPTVCAIEFSDVPAGSTFHSYIQCLACKGIINGYPDNTFRPGNNVTRGQLAKIVSNSAGFNEPPVSQAFEDVAPGSTFYDFIQRLASRNIMSGYPCGSVGEPCGAGNLPYFRPYADATRGQLSKIVANTAGFNDPAGAQIFEDVPVGHAFYDFVQRLASRSIMSGYPCGSVGEPCSAGNLPYFRPDNNATRGQTSKIVANTFMTDCDLQSR
ncbi:MAG: S-layer homology domain-containing protein [Chloroflexota bacterium]